MDMMAITYPSVGVEKRLAALPLRILMLLNPALVAISVIEHGEAGSLNLQVAVKLGVWAISLGLSFVLLHRWIGRYVTAGSVPLWMLWGLMGFSSLYAPHPAYSLGAVFSTISVIYIVATAAGTLGPAATLRLIFISLSLVSVASLLAYGWWPEWGRWVEADATNAWRLTGVTGSPNTAGFCAAAALFLGLYGVRYGAIPLGCLFGLFLLADFIALSLSDSRAAMVALGGGLVGGILACPRPWHALAFILALSLSAALLAVVDWQMIFTPLARSGSIEEITTATGRTQIWSVTLDLIAERPWIGWGYASADTILPGYADQIGHIAHSTHNLFLQVLFSCGIPGLLCLCGVLFMMVLQSIAQRNHITMGLICLLLVNGLAEASFLRGVASISTVLWALALALLAFPVYKNSGERA